MIKKLKEKNYVFKEKTNKSFYKELQKLIDSKFKEENIKNSPQFLSQIEMVEKLKIWLEEGGARLSKVGVKIYSSGYRGVSIKKDTKVIF